MRVQRKSDLLIPRSHQQQWTKRGILRRLESSDATATDLSLIDGRVGLLRDGRRSQVMILDGGSLVWGVVSIRSVHVQSARVGMITAPHRSSALSSMPGAPSPIYRAEVEPQMSDLLPQEVSKYALHVKCHDQ